jgi:hypothetical protein
MRRLNCNQKSQPRAKSVTTLSRGSSRSAPYEARKTSPRCRDRVVKVGSSAIDTAPRLYMGLCSFFRRSTMMYHVTQRGTLDRICAEQGRKCDPHRWIPSQTVTPAIESSTSQVTYPPLASICALAFSLIESYSFLRCCYLMPWAIKSSRVPSASSMHGAELG